MSEQREPVRSDPPVLEKIFSPDPVEQVEPEVVVEPVVPPMPEEPTIQPRASTPKPGVTLAPIFAAAAVETSAPSDTADEETEEERERKELRRKRIARYGGLPGCGAAEKLTVENVRFSILYR